MSDRFLRDDDQIRIWKAALALCDGRMRWPRALSKAIRMIEERDAKIKKLQALLPPAGKILGVLGHE